VVKRTIALTVVAITVPLSLGCGGRNKALRAEAPMATSESVAVSGTAASRQTVALADAAPAEESAGGSPAAPAVAATTTAAQALPERLVVEGAIFLEVDDPEDTARALRAEVERAGGRVLSERVDGAAESWRANIRLRLPPQQVEMVVSWLDRQGDITSKRIEASDVSRTLFDQEIALGNLTTTLDRLRKLLDGGGLSMQDILNIEKEMTRLRGDIERIKGEKRWLEDRVALATLDVSISRREGELMNPRTKVYPGPRLAALSLFDPDGRQRTRLGGGFVMHIVEPRFTLEIDVFEQVDEPEAGGQVESHAVLATYGVGMYSDFLGRGRRRFLNPYLGARIGYGYLDFHAFAVQGQAGIELFKHKYVLVDVDVRATALIGDNVDAGLVTGASIVFAF
jgi:hypothetical protein